MTLPLSLALARGPAPRRAYPHRTALSLAELSGRARTGRRPLASRAGGVESRSAARRSLCRPQAPSLVPQSKSFSDLVADEVAGGPLLWMGCYAGQHEKAEDQYDPVERHAMTLDALRALSLATRKRQWEGSKPLGLVVDHCRLTARPRPIRSPATEHPGPVKRGYAAAVNRGFPPSRPYQLRLT